MSASHDVTFSLTLLSVPPIDNGSGAIIFNISISLSDIKSIFFVDSNEYFSSN
jgi:hypothetical protein